MGEKQKYYIFAGLRPGGEVAAESGGEGDVEKLWRRLTSDVAELYGQPSEVTQSKFQLFTHFHADDFFVQIIVDWGTDDWPRDMVPASIRVEIGRAHV